MLNVAQIGMGGWGRDWAKSVVMQVPGVRLRAVIDADPQALDAARAHLGDPARVAFVPSLKAALNDVDFDALLITCGPATHVPLAVQALKAGKHVLTEKPFGLSTREARRAVKAAQDAQRTLMVAQNYRFFPAMRTARQLIERESYGPAGSAFIEFRRQVRRDARGRAVSEAAYPFLFDMIIHHVDLVRYVFGEDVQAVFARAWNPPWSDNEHPQSISALLALSNHMTVTYEGSWVTSGIRTPWSGVWRIDCADAQIDFTSRDAGPGNVERVTVIRPDRDPVDVRLRSVKHVDRAGALAEFAHAIRAGREPECAGQDNIRSLAVIEALARSIRSGRMEKVVQA
jgi:predicted dehydrogenase